MESGGGAAISGRCEGPPAPKQSRKSFQKGLLRGVFIVLAQLLVEGLA